MSHIQPFTEYAKLAGPSSFSSRYGVEFKVMMLLDYLCDTAAHMVLLLRPYRVLF